MIAWRFLPIVPSLPCGATLADEISTTEPQASEAVRNRLAGESACPTRLPTDYFTASQLRLRLSEGQYDCSSSFVRCRRGRPAAVLLHRVVVLIERFRKLMATRTVRLSHEI
jgi:hypothetical protein